MPYFTTSDGTEIYCTDQGEGKPVVLSHGWPLSSDAWQVEVELLADNGYPRHRPRPPRSRPLRQDVHR